MNRRLDYVTYITVSYFNYIHTLNERILYDLDGAQLFGYDVTDIIRHSDNPES